MVVAQVPPGDGVGVRGTAEVGGRPLELQEELSGKEGDAWGSLLEGLGFELGVARGGGAEEEDRLPLWQLEVGQGLDRIALEVGRDLLGAQRLQSWDDFGD